MKKVNLLVASLFVSALCACGGRESQTPCDLDLQLFREGIRTESVKSLHMLNTFTYLIQLADILENSASAEQARSCV